MERWTQKPSSSGSDPRFTVLQCLLLVKKLVWTYLGKQGKKNKTIKRMLFVQENEGTDARLALPKISKENFVILAFVIMTMHEGKTLQTHDSSYYNT